MLYLQAFYCNSQTESVMNVLSMLYSLKYKLNTFMLYLQAKPL